MANLDTEGVTATSPSQPIDIPKFQIEPIASPSNGLMVKKISFWESQTAVESSKATSAMDPRKLSAQELLQLCLDSPDKAAWEEFVRRFQPLISRVVVRSIRRWTNPSPSLADDLVQDTYVKLCAGNFRALREFVSQHENALFGFLKVVASNVVQDHFRKSHSEKHGGGREQGDVEKVQASVISASGSSDHTERRILMAEIRQCLEKQASQPNFARDYAIFCLYYRQGFTAKAISELPSIDLNVKGVESTLLRLTRMLREQLAEKPAGRVASRA